MEPEPAVLGGTAADGTTKDLRKVLVNAAGQVYN